ncbi:hypothetical protein WR25_02237 [Diploscapter pachys]|uniref:Structural maintenance of chromosomes protein 5 n=1 Tax=Diploscapter pachys TaxID=2018661 RepID=A0A2A2LF05_9BILA|nr:hypothetical protein WR25_02237 [Diploscapter pachys]
MDYPKGSIIKMIFKDFLTYRHVVVTPGSRLNVLLGPNGTGKSSVICGICLTLGGTPRSLGRSEKINDYIRHGANDGSVELHLCDEAKPSGYTSVKATFRKNTTSFELDGKNSTQMEVKQLVKTYNIQAGSPELLELHEKLIEKKKEELAYESAQNISTKNLSALEAQITNLRPKVDAYHQQVRLAEKIKLLEQRKAFLEYDEIVEEVDKQQEKVNEMRANLTEKERQFNSGHLKTVQLKANIDSAYKMMADKRAQYKHLLSTSKFNPDSYKRELAEAKNNYTRVMNAVRDFDKGLERQKQNLESLGKELDKEQQTLHKMNYDENAFRAKRANFDRRDEELRKIDQELKIRIRKIEQERSGFTDAAYNYHQKIRERAESNLRGNAEQAFYWYQQHHNEFQHPIYIPAVHICTSSQLISRYIEQFVGNDDLLMFICGSKEDDDRLQRAAKQLGLRVNSTILLPENIGGMNVRISDDLRRLGFDNLLHELIDGPDPVKQYLFNVVKTQLIPIAFRSIGNLDGVVKQLESLPYNRFIVEDLRVNITVSRYNKSNVSTQQSTIRPLRMLFRNHDKLPALHRDEKRINELHEEEMKARRAGEKMNEQRQKIQADRDKAYEENQQWKSIQNKIRELEGRIEIGKKTLEQSRSSATRPTGKSAEEELNTAKEKIYEHLFDRLKHTVRNMETARANAVKIEIYQMQIDNLSTLKREADLERVQKEGELADDKIRLKDQEGEFLKLEKNRQTKARTLYNTCRLNDTRADKLHNDTEKKKHEAISKVFAANKLPDTIDEVNKQLQTELARQNIAGDSGTVQDVEKLKQLEDEKAALEDNQSKQKELRDKWSANMLKVGIWN